MKCHWPSYQVQPSGVDGLPQPPLQPHTLREVENINIASAILALLIGKVFLGSPKLWKKFPQVCVASLSRLSVRMPASISQRWRCHRTPSPEACWFPLTHIFSALAWQREYLPRAIYAPGLWDSWGIKVRSRTGTLVLLYERIRKTHTEQIFCISKLKYYKKWKNKKYITGGSKRARSDCGCWARVQPRVYSALERP